MIGRRKEVKNLYLPMQAVVYLTKEGLAQASTMDKLMDDLCDVAVNRENYYMRLQANMISGMAGIRKEQWIGYRSPCSDNCKSDTRTCCKKHP